MSNYDDTIVGVAAVSIAIDDADNVFLLGNFGYNGDFVYWVKLSSVGVADPIWMGTTGVVRFTCPAGVTEITITPVYDNGDGTGFSTGEPTSTVSVTPNTTYPITFSTGTFDEILVLGSIFTWLHYNTDTILISWVE
jgi:hypothetical protein